MAEESEGVMSGLCLTPVIRMRERLEKGMNYIEAHRIVNDYIDAVAQGVGEYSMGFIRDGRLLKDDYYRIRDAYYVFFGHMVLYNTKTQEEYEAYDACLRMLPHFAHSGRYEEIQEIEKYLKTHKKNFLNKKKYEEIEKRKMVLFNDYIEPYRYGEIYEQISSFFNDALKLKAELMDELESGNIDPLEVKQIYCRTLYNEKTITLGPQGEDLFEPMGLLRMLLKEGEQMGMNVDAVKKYSHYILTHDD